MKIPRRNSVINEAADSLRDAIHGGEFLHHLPGVRKLSNELHVSIPTVLGAVRVLESEGLLESHPGKRTLVRTERKRESSRQKAAHKVIFLTFGHNWITGSDFYQGVLYDLQEMGIHIRVIECAYSNHANTQKELEELTAVEKPACWVLLGPSVNAQSSFARKQLPCIIDGVTIPGLPLPDFQVDYSALYRHAINHLQRKGHRRISLITTEHSAGINPESISVLRSSVQKLQSQEKPWEPIQTYDGSTERFTNLLQSLFSGRKPAPTALIIAHVKRVAGAMTWLMKRNLKIPRDISIISRDYDDVLECLYPLPAHYRQPPSAAKRFTRAILAILDKKHIRSHHRIMTEFVEGNTVAGVVDDRSFR